MYSPLSETYQLPLVSAAINCGFRNLAATPCPSANAAGGLPLSPPPEPPKACKATRLANVTACPVKRAKFIHFKVDSLVCGRQAKIGFRLLPCIHGNWAWEPSPEQVC